MTEWPIWLKIIATILVDIPVVGFMVWLLWFSRWARPKKATKDDVR